MSKWYRENGPGGQKEVAPKPAPVSEPEPTPVDSGTPEPPDAEPSGIYKDIPFYENEDGGFGAIVNGNELTSTSRKGIKNAIKRALNRTDEGGDDDESGDTDDTDA